MARPSLTLRLSQIDPDTLAADLATAMADYLGRLAVPLSPGLTVHVSGPHGTVGVALTAADLARYARGEGSLEGLVSDYALELTALLDSPLASHRGELPPVLSRWLRGDVDVSTLHPDELTDRLALVIVAAFGREAMASGEPLSVAQLAALAGVDPDHVRLLGRKGELDVDGGAVSAEEARRWLASRGR